MYTGAQCRATRHRRGYFLCSFNARGIKYRKVAG